jgi:hypothetical protein
VCVQQWCGSGAECSSMRSSRLRSCCVCAQSWRSHGRRSSSGAECSRPLQQQQMQQPQQPQAKKYRGATFEAVMAVAVAESLAMAVPERLLRCQFNYKNTEHRPCRPLSVPSLSPRTRYSCVPHAPLLSLRVPPAARGDRVRRRGAPTPAG